MVRLRMFFFPFPLNKKTPAHTFWVMFFSLHLLPDRREKTLDVGGIEPSLDSKAAALLSIAPWPFGLFDLCWVSGKGRVAFDRLLLPPSPRWLMVWCEKRGFLSLCECLQDSSSFLNEPQLEKAILWRERVDRFNQKHPEQRNVLMKIKNSAKMFPNWLKMLNQKVMTKSFCKVTQSNIYGFSLIDVWLLFNHQSPHNKYKVVI